VVWDGVMYGWCGVYLGLFMGGEKRIVVVCVQAREGGWCATDVYMGALGGGGGLKIELKGEYRGGASEWRPEAVA
jgi:hypothetical protein